MRTNFADQDIWLIGASSGIGLELARQLDQRGARLILSARRADKLQQLTAQLSERQHWSLPLDLADFASIAQAAEQISASSYQPQRIISMAATYQPMRMAELQLAQVEHIIRVNLSSQYQLSKYALELLPTDAFGQLAFCASVAGYLGLPNSQPYAGSKAGLINMTESLRLELGKSRSNIDVKLINPGFVSTDMTAKNDFSMPMIISAEQAAEHIIKGLQKPAFEIHFPKKFTLLLKTLQLLPYSWRRIVLQRI